MTHQTKAEIIRHFRKAYLRASKAEKTRILNTIIESTGYSRKHAIALLAGAPKPRSKSRRARPSRYNHLYETLVRIWAASNFLCGKRLKPFLPALVASLVFHKEIKLSKDDKALVLTVSAATIDRVLARARKGLNPKGKATTKPGTLLKHQIPIRTFAEWNENKPGFLEVDLVAHCGNSTRGEYINTLNMTDVATGWTTPSAFMGRSQQFCTAAIDELRPTLPFAVMGIDSDNGAEFINDHLMRYCQREHITFTRARPNKKNDSCYVEQKNWDVVRKMIGYGRFDTYQQLDIINRIYRLLAFYQNYFQPSQKLVSKTRIGAKVIKKYDTAQTPAQRLIARKDTPAPTRKLLKDTFRQINPVQLLRSITQLLEELNDTLS